MILENLASLDRWLERTVTVELVVTWLAAWFGAVALWVLAWYALDRYTRDCVKF